jgi:hypothetical protein
MFLASCIVFAAAALNPPEQIEEDEIALTEKAAVIDEDVVEDGELIFDDVESVAEVEEE